MRDATLGPWLARAERNPAIDYAAKVRVVSAKAPAQEWLFVADDEQVKARHDDGGIKKQLGRAEQQRFAHDDRAQRPDTSGPAMEAETDRIIFRSQLLRKWRLERDRRIGQQIDELHLGEIVRDLDTEESRVVHPHAMEMLEVQL